MLLELLILVSARSIFNLIEILQDMSTYDIDYFNINIEYIICCCKWLGFSSYY